MNSHCEICDMEPECAYPYKPCDCCNYRKFVRKDKPVVEAQVIQLPPKENAMEIDDMFDDEEDMAQFSQPSVTGRLVSSEPNLQGLPVHTADGQRIRAAFIQDTQGERND